MHVYRVLDDTKRRADGGEVMLSDERLAYIRDAAEKMYRSKPGDVMEIVDEVKRLRLERKTLDWVIGVKDKQIIDLADALDENNSAKDIALQTAREALEGVLRVADRKTVHFAAARAALTAIDEALPQAENTAK